MSLDATGAPQHWIPNHNDFGARLALIRWQMGWNMKEASTLCGFPVANWREWETRGRLPRDLVNVATQIANETHVDRVWLLTGQGQAGDVTTDGPGGGTAARFAAKKRTLDYGSDVSSVVDLFTRQPLSA